VRDDQRAYRVSVRISLRVGDGSSAGVVLPAVHAVAAIAMITSAGTVE
jgi:hypothetical protein